MIHITEILQRLRKKRYYKGKTYGIVRRDDPKCGLFSFVVVMIGGIDKCIKEGLIPIIDMQTYGNPYLEENQIGKENAWEFYFQQPMGVGLQRDIMPAAAIIDAGTDIREEERPNTSMNFLTDWQLIQYWREIFHKYIKFKPEIQCVLDEKKKVLLDNKRGKKLGILCRGTDYTSLKPAGHPIQPDVDTVIAKAKELMEERECKYIFLATEDKDILDQFQKELGDCVIINQGDRFSNTGGRYLAQIMEEEKINKYNNGLNYLTTIYLLSQCNCLLAGRTSGLLGALLMGHVYEYQYFWDCGSY